MLCKKEEMMKEIRSVVIPVAWTGIRGNQKEESDAGYKLLQDFIKNGFVVTHVTSSTINGVMHVYHLLEREVE